MREEGRNTPETPYGAEIGELGAAAYGSERGER
jgi:hypothetical protein